MTIDEEIVHLDRIARKDFLLYQYLALKAGWKPCPQCGYLANPRQTAGYVCGCLSPEFSK